MTGSTAAALACSISLIVWAMTMRALTGTWLNPGAFFALFWCFAGILPMILAPQEPVSMLAIAWLLASGIAVSVGAVIGNWGFKTRRLANPAPSTDRELVAFGTVCLVAVILGAGSNVAFIAGTPGISFSDVLDIQKLVLVSNQAYFSRYLESGAPASPPFSQALLPFVYLAPAVGGVVFQLRREIRWKLLGAISFLPAVAVTILQTTKAAFLFALILWLSSYFAMRLRQGKLGVFTRAHILTALGAGAVVVVFFFGVGLARLATTDVTMANIVYAKFVTGAFGHMTVFSQWLSEYISAPFGPSLGKVTFAGPLEMLGFSQRIPGLFENLVELVTGDVSNIYTGFRPLIQDFTIPGALTILVLLGVVGGVGFRLVAAGKWSASPLLMISYVTIFWTPITWFWIYNSLTATVVALGIIVWLVRIWRGSSERVLAQGMT
ncbi:MAG: O-antigen polymerase [Gemmatimonadaceae bacterium]